MLVVIGDFIQDEFIYGNAIRISPEAPNLILDIEKIKRIKGGAYNVVEHLRNLDNRVVFVSLVGKKSINQTKNNIFFNEIDKIIYDKKRLMTIKSRMVAKYRHTTLLRLDQEERNNITHEQENYLIEIVINIINSGVCEGICIIDYCKGVVTENLANKIIEYANEYKIKTYIDTKSKDIKKFANAYLLKPNKNEFLLMKSLYESEGTSDEIFCKNLFKLFKIENILRTLGEDGLELYNKGKKVVEINGNNCEVKELSGAGDSVLAATVHLDSKGIPLRVAVEKANKAASIFVSRGVDYRICESDLN